MKGLVDAFGRHHTYLRISITDICNLRCIYCAPAAATEPAGKHSGNLLSADEIERLAKIFAGLGITKIRLTGGEPLARAGAPEIVARLAQIDGIQSVGMTTNGVNLKRYASSLQMAGLSGLNISLDTLRRERFNLITGGDRHEDVLAGIDAALSLGFTPLKLNVVVMGGINDDELPGFVECVRLRPISVRFIEYMPFRFNAWNNASFVPASEMKRHIEAEYRLTPIGRQDAHSPIAREYAIEGWKGTIGFITSMSDHFCNTCNRLRLTADGSLKSCLFHQAETHLRHALRNGAPDGIIEAMIRSAVILKPEAHPAIERLVDAESRAMVEIGG
jgi:GTP 3',8-cyclase